MQRKLNLAKRFLPKKLPDINEMYIVVNYEITIKLLTLPQEYLHNCYMDTKQERLQIRICL